MKRIMIAAALCFGLAACGYTDVPTSDEVQHARQERALQEASREFGSPNIVNFTRKHLLKDIYEMLDQPNLVTYTYTFAEMTGRPVFFCNSIGYPFPFSTQYSNPEVIAYTSSYGIATLPQAEPDGTFPPGASEASWVLCVNPTTHVASPVYSEPRLMAAQYRLTADSPEGTAAVRIDFGGVRRAPAPAPTPAPTTTTAPTQN